MFCPYLRGFAFADRPTSRLLPIPLLRRPDAASPHSARPNQDKYSGGMLLCTVDGLARGVEAACQLGDRIAAPKIKILQRFRPAFRIDIALT